MDCMRTKTVEIIRKRIVARCLIGLSVHIEKPHIGWRIQIDAVCETVPEGSMLWQMYK